MLRSSSPSTSNAGIAFEKRAPRYASVPLFVTFAQSNTPSQTHGLRGPFMSQAASLETPVGRFVDENTLSDTPTRVANWKMFMWLFLAQDAMMFFTMFAGYLALRISSSDW